MQCNNIVLKTDLRKIKKRFSELKFLIYSLYTNLHHPARAGRDIFGESCI